MELPNTKIRSVLPSTPQIGNPVNIVDAWNGAAVDAKRNRLIVWGGGHNDYYGNEVYALDLGTLSIKRIVDPSPNTSQSSRSSALPDGTPVSRHTYGGLSYIGHADRMFAVGGSMAPCGSADMSTWTYDFAAQQWQRLNTSPLGVNFGFMAAYDAVAVGSMCGRHPSARVSAREEEAVRWASPSPRRPRRRWRSCGLRWRQPA